MTAHELADCIGGRPVVTSCGNILAIQTVDGRHVTFRRCGKLCDGAPAMFVDMMNDWWGECCWLIDCFRDATTL